MKKKIANTTPNFPAHDRQGDVMLMNSDETEFGERLDNGKEAIVAYGEVTGHKHAVYNGGAQLFAGKKEPRARFLRVVKNLAPLQHEEHEAIPLDAPVKRQIKQFEYAPAELRQVAD